MIYRVVQSHPILSVRRFIQDYRELRVDLMSSAKHPGFFDIAERADKLTRMGDPLVGLNERIDWEAFRADLGSVYEKPRKSNAGAKPIDVVLMFKVLVLQQF